MKVARELDSDVPTSSYFQINPDYLPESTNHDAEEPWIDDPTDLGSRVMFPKEGWKEIYMVGHFPFEQVIIVWRSPSRAYTQNSLTLNIYEAEDAWVWRFQNRKWEQLNPDNADHVAFVEQLVHLAWLSEE